MDNRILGLDPSTVATGWAILDVQDRDEGVTASGIYHPEGSSLDARLLDAFHWTRGTLEMHEPTMLAIETTFFKMNAQTLISLASIGAAFRLAATAAGIPVVEVAPAQRCKALGLAGNAAKNQVLYTVNAVYNLTLSDHNEADAVAVAAAAALKLREAAYEMA